MNVTVYTTPSCPYCHQVKEYLQRQAVPFKELDVARDATAAAEMVRLSGQRGVPVTVIDGQVVVGYDRTRLDHLLARSRRPNLGVAVADAAEMAAKGRTQLRTGAYVGRVTPAMAGAHAGLQPGDVILSLAGSPVGGALDLENLLARLQPGQAVKLVFERNGQQHNTVVQF